MTDTEPLSRTSPGTLTTAGATALLAGTALANVIFGTATIVAPTAAADLDADAGAAGLFVALFSAGFAAVLVLGGRLGDRLGRRRLFRIGLGLLAVTSLGVSVVPGLSGLLLVRAVQGVAAGLMLPQSLTTIQATTTGERRLRLMSVYAAVLGVGTTAGQIGAGALATLGPSTWRLAFAAVGVLTLAVLLLTGLIVETMPPTASGIDAVGSSLLAIAIVSFLVPVGLGRGAGWPWWTWASLVLALLAALMLVWWERRLPARNALVPPDALRTPILRIGLLLTLLFFTGYGAFVFLFSLTASSGLDLDPLAVGISLAPFALAFITGTLSSPRLTRMQGSARLMQAAAVVQSLALIAVGLIVWLGWPTPSLLGLQPVLLVLGFAQALVYTPLIGTIMGSLPPDLTGTASGLLSTVQQVGLALGVAVIAVLADVFSNAGGAGFAGCVLLNVLLAVGFAIVVRRLRRHA
ncbi:MFS transporter [Microbacterium tumbae]